jgi:DNA-binding response OmpR family regulator
MDLSIRCIECDGEGQCEATLAHKATVTLLQPQGASEGARCHCVVQQWQSGKSRCCELVLDAEARTLRYQSASYRLTRAEFAILSVLVDCAPEWIPSGVLIFNALGTHHHRRSSLARVHVHHMRSKLGPVARCVEGQQGRGYRFVPTNVGPLAHVVATSSATFPLSCSEEALVG